MTLKEARTLIGHSGGNARYALDQYAEHVREELGAFAARIRSPDNYDFARPNRTCGAIADDLEELRERLGGEAPEEQTDG